MTCNSNNNVHGLYVYIRVWDKTFISLIWCAICTKWRDNRRGNIWESFILMTKNRTKSPICWGGTKFRPVVEGVKKVSANIGLRSWRLAILLKSGFKNVLHQSKRQFGWGSKPNFCVLFIRCGGGGIWYYYLKSPGPQVAAFGIPVLALGPLSFARFRWSV